MASVSDSCNSTFTNGQEDTWLNALNAACLNYNDLRSLDNLCQNLPEPKTPILSLALNHATNHENVCRVLIHHGADFREILETKVGIDNQLLIIQILKTLFQQIFRSIIFLTFFVFVLRWLRRILKL